MYLRTIVPIGLLYSGSLVCSNLVYLYLSVAFIQMLKAAAPVAVLFTSWAWGVADPSMSKLVNILFIVCGVAIASAGEIQFSWIGFFFQIGGIFFEAMRLVMIQVMLSGEGLNMDPLVSLYYYAPVCAFMNFLVACTSELPRFQWDDLARTGYAMLFINALVAFLLNVASVSLVRNSNPPLSPLSFNKFHPKFPHADLIALQIGKTSGLVMTLTGIFKSILLVIVSVLIWDTQITFLQGAGYSFALAGLVYYSLGYDQLLGLYHSSSAWFFGTWQASFSSDNTGMSRMAKRVIPTVFIGLLTIVILVRLLGSNDALPKSSTLS